jgi:hypothetical protein
MRSPKFGIRKEELATVVNKRSLNSAWQRTVRVAMRRQYLADPIELLDFHTRLPAEFEQIEERLLNGSYLPEKPRLVLVEKSKGLCRQIVVPNVRDALLIQCLSDAFYASIKDRSPSKNAFFEPERHLFSQITNERRTYGSFRSWLKFQKEIFNFAKEHKYIIVTDISNYFDYVGHSHLRNVITDYVDGAKESILDLLIFIFSEMTWQPDYMPRVGIGLPQIDLDGPRLLANCFLYELDKMITRISGIDYVRFMDDIDIGVDDIPAAKRILRDIDLTLQSRQVRLNAGKTKILTQDEAVRHFKIFENEHLSAIEEALESKATSGASTRVPLGQLERLLVHWHRKGVFNDGNGDKILKRAINLLSKYGGRIDQKIIDDCLARRPSLRETIMRHMYKSSPNVSVLESVLAYLESDYVVDDASFIDFAANFVDSRATIRADLVKRIYSIVEKLIASKQDSLLHAAFVILSKIGDERVIARHLEGTYDLWKNNYYLGRVIGSLRPILWETKYRNKYMSLVQHSRNLGARGVIDFLFQVGADRHTYQSVRRFLFAPNVTFPNRITHGKFVVLWSVLQGGLLSDREKDVLRTIHRTASADPYYAFPLHLQTPQVRRRSSKKPRAIIGTQLLSGGLHGNRLQRRATRKSNS